MVYGRADQRCEACGSAPDRGQSQWLEAHERWEYDQVHRIQRLKRLVCLCTNCHQTTHYGFAKVKGREAEALAHLMAVNRWDRNTALRHVDAAFALWQERSRYDWTLDLAMLTTTGITVKRPASAADRNRVAQAALEPTEATSPEEPSRPLPPAGWFQDPAGRYAHRWWDGTAWTDDVGNQRGEHLRDPL